MSNRRLLFGTWLTSFSWFGPLYCCVISISSTTRLDLIHQKKLRTLFSAPPVIHRDWTPPASAKNAASSGELQLLPLLHGRRLAAEIVYVLRPLVHLMVSVTRFFLPFFYHKLIHFGLFLKCLAYFDFFQNLLRPLRMFLIVLHG